MKLDEHIRIELLYKHDVIYIPVKHGQLDEIKTLVQNANELNLDDEIDVIIQQRKKKRSLNANAYSWTLSDKLADKLQISKDECHRMLLQRYGQTAKDRNGHNIILSVRADIPEDDLIKSFGYVAKIKSGWVNETEFIHYRVLKPSHEFDSKEMSIFIQGIVSECKDQGIETMTPDEIKRMVSTWKLESESTF